MHVILPRRRSRPHPALACGRRRLRPAVLSPAQAQTSPRAPREIVEDRLTVELRRRHDGWTAERQRIFLNTLANTGRITEAAEMADITPRYAYRLRNHPQGAPFARRGMPR